MWKTIGIVVVVVVVGVLAFAATRPDDFTVQRSIAIKAEPAKIYPLLVDFSQWPAWSPWEKLDPTMKRTLSGAASGGAPSTRGTARARSAPAGWRSRRRRHPRSSSSSTSCKPFEAHNIADFALAPRPDATTEVTWLMRGPAPFVSKLMGVFVDMDKMIGKDFEAGLANLKAAAEK